MKYSLSRSPQPGKMMDCRLVVNADKKIKRPDAFFVQIEPAENSFQAFGIVRSVPFHKGERITIGKNGYVRIALKYICDQKCF